MAVSKIVKPKSNWTVIWENPNPNAAFANNQIINVDLSKYSDLCFELKLEAGSAYNYTYYVSMPVVDAITTLSMIGTTIYQRAGVTVDTSTNTINLGAGGKVEPYQARVENPSYAVPLRILAR